MAVEGNRGAVLLAELKALVDSFPHHERAGVIKMIEIAFKELNADLYSWHSVDRQPEARTSGESPSSKTPASPDLSDGLQNKIKNEE
jgi:hypothetical protein